MVSSLLQPILRICTYALLLVFALFFVTSNCVVFTHCELGQALLENGFTYSELGDWICLADKCTKGKLNTSLVKSHQWTDTKRSSLYGLFSVSSMFWCHDADQPEIKGCGITCSKLLDDDLTDDLVCARNVSKEHKNFGSWNQFTYCRLENTTDYIEGCNFTNVPGLKGTETGEPQRSLVLPLSVSFSVLAVLFVIGLLLTRLLRRLGESESDRLIRIHALQPRDISFDKLNVLGQGNFGIVYGGVYRDTTVALKTMKNDQDCRSLHLELKVMAFLEEHPFIPQLLGTYRNPEENDKLYLVVECCALGNLHDYLESKRRDCLETVMVERTDSHYRTATLRFVPNKHVSVHLMLTWSFQIADAMVFMASRNVIHGDLASRNVLLKSVTNIKLTDFGLSKKLYTDSLYQRAREKEVPWRWCSPEALTSQTYSTNSDIWAFGITMWEIHNLAQLPYATTTFDKQMGKILSGESMELDQPVAASDEMYEIMKPCWALIPAERSSFTVLRDMLQEQMNKNQAMESDSESDDEFP